MPRADPSFPERRVVAGAGLVVAVVVVLRPTVLGAADVQKWATVFLALFVQAVPFVVLGALLAALVGAAPEHWPRRLAGIRARVAVPAMGLAGTALPGCECGSVPTAAAMVEQGVSIGPSVAFMLSAPATNPVVLAATASAFPGQPRVVAARFVAGLLVAVGVGSLTATGLLGRPVVRRRDHRHRAGGHRLVNVARGAVDEVLRSMGLLTAGAAAAACSILLTPRGALHRVAEHEVLGVLAMAVLATVLCVCSQADAFVARSFAFPLTAQLTFMVVGAAVDLKLVAMQAGAFGIRFVAACAAVTFAVALVVAWLVARVVL